MYLKLIRAYNGKSGLVEFTVLCTSIGKYRCNEEHVCSSFACTWTQTTTPKYKLKLNRILQYLIKYVILHPEWRSLQERCSKLHIPGLSVERALSLRRSGIRSTRPFLSAELNGYYT